DFRFAGGALDDCSSFSQSCGHHDVCGAKDRGTRPSAKEHGRTDQAFGAGVNVTFLDDDFGAQCLETLEVKVNGARSYDTTTRQGNRRFSQAPEQRPHDTNGTAHFADEVVVPCPLDFFCVNANGAVFKPDLCAQPGEDL